MAMSSWFACCTSRDNDGEDSPLLFGEKSFAFLSPDEFLTAYDDDSLEFFECFETSWELAAANAETRSSSSSGSGVISGKCRLIANDAMQKLRGGVDRVKRLVRFSYQATKGTLKFKDEDEQEEAIQDLAECAGLTRDCTGALDPEAVRLVLEEVRERWKNRMAELRQEVRELGEATPELKWANIATARRMLSAHKDIQEAKKQAGEAVELFIKALEFRARDRQLFETMKFEPASDMRVIAQDLQAHPVVYLWAGSQTAPLKKLRDQFMVSFEAACRIAGDDGQISFVIDMNGLQLGINTDMGAIRELSEILGTVYAERICKITIVDFSMAAQVGWSLLKKCLKPATAKKFDFVNKSQAVELLRPQFDAESYKSICDLFKMNRNRNATAEERFEMAQRTNIGNGPLPSYEYIRKA
jgi:hypothetical protein